MLGSICPNCNRESTRQLSEGLLTCMCSEHVVNMKTEPHQEPFEQENSKTTMDYVKDTRSPKNEVTLFNNQYFEDDDTSVDNLMGKVENAQPNLHGPRMKAMRLSSLSSPQLSKMTERQQIAYLLRESNGGIDPPSLASSTSLPPSLSSSSNSLFAKGPPTPTTAISTSYPEFIENVVAPSVIEKEEKVVLKESITGKRPSAEDLDESWGDEGSNSEPVKRRKKEKTKKEDNVRNGVQKPAKKQRKNEAICTLCEEGGNLMMCEGPCLRSFHADCLGLKGLQAGSKWECNDCSSHANQCFFCKQKGEVGRDLMKCRVHQCGKYYHYKCVSQLKLAKLINNKTKKFNCPLHYCATCEISGDGKQSVHCFRCPTAYHVICMPPKARLLTDKSKETRKTGLILCPKHTNEPPLVSRDPGASLLDAIEAEMNEEHKAEQEERHQHPSHSEESNGNVISHHDHADHDMEASDANHREKKGKEKKVNGRVKMEYEMNGETQGMVIDQAEEEVHNRRYRSSERESQDLLRTSQGIRKDQVQHMLAPMMNPALCLGLEEVERELLEEFSREKELQNGLLSEQSQPPKQKQKKMKRIQMAESKFLEELNTYKNNLLSMRNLMLARNQTDFEIKVQLLKTEHQRQNIEVEETLTRRFLDWGMLAVKQKQEEWSQLNTNGNANNNHHHQHNHTSPKGIPTPSSSPCPSLLASPVDASPSLPASPEEHLTQAPVEPLEALMSLQGGRPTMIHSPTASTVAMMPFLQVPPLKASMDEIEKKRENQLAEESAFDMLSAQMDEQMEANGGTNEQQERDNLKVEESDSILEAAATMIQF